MRYYMKKLVAVFMLICLSGCVSRSVKDNIRDKHAVLYVYTKRINNPDQNRRPTQQENEAVIKAMLKDIESLDRVLNNWKPTITIPEVDIEGNSGK